ncbi:MAG TPA: hypothetical protein VD926_07455 [Acidimicrobiales bacterium]|nr:hypothetical protein [Acidimicrobiales bacterium]
MRRLLLLPLALLLAVVLAACGDDSGSTQDDDETFDSPSSTTEEPDEPEAPEGAVVFTPDEEETDIYGNEVTWTPDAEQLRIAEEALGDFIADHPEDGVEDLEEYHRQYTGTGEEGEVISVNALCVDSGIEGWEDEIILVNDGGSCFWQAEFDVESLDVVTFNVNGEA